MQKAVFLDKDGTLVENVPYNVDPQNITFCAGVKEGLRLLKDLGYVFIVISNQAGLAHGYFTEDELAWMVTCLEKKLLEEVGIFLLDFYYCPHHPQGSIATYKKQCTCRKPEPGLLLTAAHDWGIDLQSSWFMGDILHDMEAAHWAGCKAVLVDTGNESEWNLCYPRLPDYQARDFAEAASMIASHSHTYPTIKGGL